MKQVQSYTAVLCVLLLAAPPVPAQDTQKKKAEPEKAVQQDPRGPQLDTERPHWYSGMQIPYQPRYVPPVNVSNSSRVDALLRAGSLYLSLSDAIALAVENNLEVEIQRYEFSLAETDVMRAKAGSAILGIPTSVFPGVPTGAGPLLGSLNTGLAEIGRAHV